MPGAAGIAHDDDRNGWTSARLRLRVSGAHLCLKRDSLTNVNVPRRCCRPGCPHYAVATLTFVYVDSTAVVAQLLSVIIQIQRTIGKRSGIDDPADLSPIQISRPTRVAIYGCVAGMLYLGLFPSCMLELATRAIELLR